MITVGVIRNGGTYLSQHLRQNDYWAEGEKQVCGEWIGQAATMLGLEGAVTDAPFEALRSNRDWQTGKRLTARANKKTRMALFDIQISAPKDVSVLAIVGEDERVREAFVESVKSVLVEMEHFAAVRERPGDARDTSTQSVTFDDGQPWRRNLPWSRYTGANWDYADPETIRVEIGDWQVVICGHNLESLFKAIETEQLQRIRAHPEFANDPNREPDVFATSIRFVHLSALALAEKRKPQRQLDLGIG